MMGPAAPECCPLLFDPGVKAALILFPPLPRIDLVHPHLLYFLGSHLNLNSPYTMCMQQVYSMYCCACGETLQPDRAKRFLQHMNATRGGGLAGAGAPRACIVPELQVKAGQGVAGSDAGRRHGGGGGSARQHQARAAGGGGWPR